MAIWASWGIAIIGGVACVLGLVLVYLQYRNIRNTEEKQGALMAGKEPPADAVRHESEVDHSVTVLGVTDPLHERRRGRIIFPWW